MTHIVDIPYGGTYREEWDEHYKLTVEYKNQKHLQMAFQDGRWLPTADWSGLSNAEEYFPAAASAITAAGRFIASGQTAQDLSSLSPDHACGAVFAAELMRILMDDYGLRMEVVYPYVSSFCPLKPKCTEILRQYQPRTEHVLQLLLQLKRNSMAVRHDTRLKNFRFPFGSVKTEEIVSLAVECPENEVEEADLELYGDDFFESLPMQKTTEGFALSFRVPEAPEVLWYRFLLQKKGKQYWLCPSPDGIHGWLRKDPEEGFRLTVYDRAFETPKWFQNAVLYQIFPDRFAFSNDGKAEEGIEYHRKLGQTPELHKSIEEAPRWKPRSFEKEYSPDDFYGGRLSAICEQLPYLKALGVSCLYLNPIVEARSNHRYDTSDYCRVDPILGSNDDFRCLCENAGRLGIRILCDGVFSHTGADSIYFNRDGHYPGPGACQPEASPYDSWYIFRKFPKEYQCWWGFRDLPEVDEHDLSWQRYIVSGSDSIVRRWLRMGASGWRLDVADELPDDVLQMIRKAAKQEKEDAVILGEVWEDAVLKESYGTRRRYALGNALDSIMNYPFRNAVLDFLLERSDAFALADFLTSQQLNYPQPLYRSLMNLLSSHDVERLRTALACGMSLKEFSREDQLIIEAGLTDADRERAEKQSLLAFAIQYSIPGVPCIYYGDEQGMEGTNDPFNRRPFMRNPKKHIQEYLAMLAEKRESVADARAFFMACDPDVLLILRFSEISSQLTVINRAEESRAFFIEYQGYTCTGEVSALSAEFY